ncbi:WSC domain-containing protein [Aspergillus insuetus]
MGTTLLSLTTLATTLHLSTASPTPGLYADPNTIASCVEWYDNTEGLTCKELRAYFTITPEQFTEWNPSERLHDTASSLSASASATTSTATSTTSTTTPAPSPTAWTELGCYFDDPSHLSLLESRVSANDESLTISKCQDACYRAAYQFAGVKGGNECWCSPFVGGEWARNQKDCNLPCTGDEGEICGGEESVNVFEAVDDEEDESVAGSPTPSDISSASPSSSTSTSGSEDEDENAVDDSPAESKASRNRALIYWLYFDF